MQRAEFETKLNRVCLHIYKEEHYEEDYQMPMLRQNHLDGILEVEGCEVDGKARYTYEISGLVSMKTMYEKTCIKKQEIETVITRILEVTETLQRYMLNPNCLVLRPEYIFFKEGCWFFCYFPGMKEDLCKLFHELTEYFVKMLDYEDTEGIFLAYELHKATLQEHYDLELIMKECRGREAERKKRSRQRTGTVKYNRGNVCKKPASSEYGNGNLERKKLESPEYGNGNPEYKKDGYGKSESTGYNFGSRKDAGYDSGSKKDTGYAFDRRKDVGYGYGNKVSARFDNGERENDKYQYGDPDSMEYEHTNYGNIFSVMDEDDHETNTDYPKDGRGDQFCSADSIREENEGGWWKSWRKAANGIRRKRWGSWDDLILETDGQEDES